jgi:hypothetical protein
MANRSKSEKLKAESKIEAKSRRLKAESKYNA